MNNEQDYEEMFAESFVEQVPFDEFQIVLEQLKSQKPWKIIENDKNVNDDNDNKNENNNDAQKFPSKYVELILKNENNVQFRLIGNVDVENPNKLESCVISPVAVDLDLKDPPKSIKQGIERLENFGKVSFLMADVDQENDFQLNLDVCC